MTRGQLETAIRVRLGLPSGDALFADTQLDELIDEAVYAFSMEADWPWLQETTTFPTAAGTQEYPIVAGTTIDANDTWLRTKLLTPENANSLRLISMAELREFGTATTDRDFPTTFAIWEETIFMAPVPNSVITITHDYIRAEYLMTTDGESPAAPAWAHYAIVHYAAALGHLRQNEGERSELEMKRYEQWLKKVLDNRRRSSANVKVKVRPGSHLV